jgi:hypothetical protein
MADTTNNPTFNDLFPAGSNKSKTKPKPPPKKSSAPRAATSGTTGRGANVGAVGPADKSSDVNTPLANAGLKKLIGIDSLTSDTNNAELRAIDLAKKAARTGDPVDINNAAKAQNDFNGLVRQWLSENNGNPYNSRSKLLNPIKNVNDIPRNLPVSGSKTNGTTGTTDIATTPGSKGFLATGDQLKNAGPEFTTRAVMQPGSTGSGYANAGPNSTAASPWVNVVGSVTKGYSTASYKETGIVKMSPDAAYNSFVKGLYTDSPDTMALIGQMNKIGINTSKMTKAEIAGVYKNALDETASAITAGASDWNVLKSIAEMAKSGKYGTGGGGGGGGSARNTTQTSYSKKVFTEDEFRTIGNAVAQNLLGRTLSNDEIAKALAAANAESAKTPGKTVTKTHYNADGTSSTSNVTSTSGFNLQNSLQKQLGQTAESQAYTTNNVFNDAMRILASRIG